MLRRHFAALLSEERSRALILKWAALFSALDDARAERVSLALQRLRFTNREALLAQTILSGLPQVDTLSRQEALSPRDLYRFFRAYGSAGLESVCLALAEGQATGLAQREPRQWQRRLEVASCLLRYYEDEWQRLLALPRLLKGEELMRALELAPGPLLGEALGGDPGGAGGGRAALTRGGARVGAGVSASTGHRLGLLTGDLACDILKRGCGQESAPVCALSWTISDVLDGGGEYAISR